MSKYFSSLSINIAGTDTPPLSESDVLELSCGPDGCDANCCANGPPIVLTPYEISRIGRSHIVRPVRNRCAGLVHAPASTVADYLRDQDTKISIEMADRWIEFVSEMEKWRFPDRPVTSIAFHMMVYQPDAPSFLPQSDPAASLEERFLLRLAFARKELPRFL